ncbi:MAG: GGIII-like transmembrane region-containing protein [Candidatus Heimdallarchaeota archaeon]
MDSRKFKLIIIVSLIGSFPLALLSTSNVFASKPIFDNQSLSTNGLGFYYEDFFDTTYKAAATTAWGWGAGQLTSERNFSYVVQDFYTTAGICKGIDIQGRKAYIVSDHPASTDSLEILDITSPAFITQMSSRFSFDEMISIAIHGDYLYAGLNMSWQQINVYNATDPLALGGGGIYIDHQNVDGAVTDIAPWGHLIYFTVYNSTSHRSLRVLDASDPDNTQLITNAWSNNKSYGLDIAGQLAYVAASDEGFYVLNISDKYNAIEYDFLPTPGFASDVVVDGRFAYLAAGEAGVHVIEVFDPQNIVLLGTYDTPGFARNLKKQGNTLYVADMDGGLVTLDVADPNNPSYVSRMVFSTNKVWDVDTFGNYFFVATDAGVYSVLASADGGGLMDFGANAYRSTFDGYQCWDVKVQGDIAYVAAGTDGFYTLNVRDPLNPVLLDRDPIAGVDFQNLDVEGQYAYLVDNTGIYVYDISNPANIILVGIEGGGNLNDIDVEGELMYVSFGVAGGGIASLNVSNPQDPVFKVNTIFGTNITSLDVQGHHLYSVNYIGGAGPGLYCYDIIPNVFSPDYLGSRADYSTFTNIHVDGDLAYCSDTDWLVVFGVTNPVGITTVVYVDWGSATNYIDSFGACTFGTNIINAGGSEGVHFLDALDITPSFFVGTNFPDANSALKVTTHGDFTYVANKTSLVILRHFESPGDTYVAGSYFGESLEVDTVTSELIHKATLSAIDFVPVGTGVDYYLSADGGAHWELVTPGVEHIFVNVGSELHWRAELVGPNDRSVHIYEIAIDYFFNLKPTTPHLIDPGNVSTSSSVPITWTVSTDDDGIDHYELQIDTVIGFTTPTTYNVTGATRTITGLTNGTYYFRVRAVDVWDLASDWSNVEDIKVEITALEWWVYVIVGGGLVLIILIIVIVVKVRKRKTVATR